MLPKCRFKSINIGVAVYNEAETLNSTLSSLIKDLNGIEFTTKPTIYICFNGCSDSTIYNFLSLKKKIDYPVIVLSSPKGKIRAHKKIINKIDNLFPIVFLDADIIIPPGTLFRIINELFDKNRVIVSTYPYSLQPKKMAYVRKVLYNVINIKRIFPQIEVAKYSVSDFHPGETKPFIVESRIYFHGRCFIIRNKEVYKFPKDNSGIVGDDTFLSFVVLNNYPPGSIKVMYDVPVYSHPQLSIKSYIRSWFRIRKDLDNIYLYYPQFIRFRELVKMRMNWSFVLRDLNFEYKIYALLFSLLRLFEYLSYRLVANNINTYKIWTYKSKSRDY